MPQLDATDRFRRSAARRPLRVCHLAYTFYENDNRVMRYAEALQERGDEVDVVSLRRPGQPSSGLLRGVRVLRIQRRTVTEKRSWVYLTKILWFLVKATALLTVRQVRRRYDVVHVHNVPDFLVFAAVVPKMLGARIILDIHDVLPELYSGKFRVQEQSRTFKALLRLERLSCRFADHVIVANDLWRDKVAGRSASDERCTAVLNYPDLRLFKPSEIQKEQRPFVVIYPGSLNWHQGLDIAVRAFARVRQQMPNAVFRIYGEGPARAELLGLIEECGVSDCVSVLPPLPLREIAPIMATADLAVVPKRANGFGNEAFSTKILEFMACGVPLIVSRTRIDAHYFDESLVRFFTPGDEDDLARALQECFERRLEQGERIQKARLLAVRYGWQERVVDYYALIESLLPVGLRTEGNA